MSLVGFLPEMWRGSILAKPAAYRSREGMMNEDVLPAGTAAQARVPRGPRAAIIISALIAFALITSNIRAAMGPPTMINVEVPWLGFTEAGAILLAMWPAWRGRLWAVSAQAAVLLFVAVHSYWLLSTDRWMSGGGTFVDGNAALWRTGFGEAYLVVMLPYFIVIVSEATFVIRQRKTRRSTTEAIAGPGDAGAVLSGDGTVSGNVRSGGKGNPVRAPVWLRVVVATTGLVAVDMTGLLIGPFWQGVPEGVVLLAVLWPAWMGRLWAVSVQAAVLLISVFHSYFFYSQLSPLSGPGGYYLIFLAPLFVLILFDVLFAVPRLRSRRQLADRAIAR